MTESQETSIRRRQSLRLVAIGVLVAVFVVVVADNVHSVTFSYVVGDTTAPLVVMLVVAGILGVIVGFLIGRHRNR